MKDIFGKDNKKSKHHVSGVSNGDYATMIKTRKEKLPEIEDTIREALKDYEGQSICIVIQNEDENGKPESHHIMMAGVSRMECQLAMAKSLSHASKQALDLLMESANGDVTAMLRIAAAMVDEIKES